MKTISIEITLISDIYGGAEFRGNTRIDNTLAGAPTELVLVLGIESTTVE